MTAGKPSRCQDVPGLISKTIQDAFTYLLHDWPVIVIPVYIYNTTHMDTTHTLYISNIRLENVYKYCTPYKDHKNNSARVYMPSTKF